MPWTDLDDLLIEGASTEKAPTRPRPRSAWQRFKDSFIEGALHSNLSISPLALINQNPALADIDPLNIPLSAEPIARRYWKMKGKTDEQINRAERRLSEQFAAKREADPIIQKGDPRASVVRGVIDIAGNILGGADPTYVLGPGKTAAQRIAAQAGINAGIDAQSQAKELGRGVRDEYDPWQTGLNAAAGAGFQGAGELARVVSTGRRVNRGSKMPGWKEVNDVIVRDLEGGGTLANPKVSPKGAMGPQQVMPETARKPGFGIRPWDGKSQADLARVGRQYSAAMMDKYDGNVEKVLAAYNAGPGRVDGLIKRYGEDWFTHLPRETQNYTIKGLKKLGYDQVDNGNVSYATEWVDVPNRADTPALQPDDVKLAEDLIQQADDTNVTSINDYKYRKASAELEDAFARQRKHLEGRYWLGRHTLDSIERGENPLTPDEAAEDLTAWTNLKARLGKSKEVDPEMMQIVDDGIALWQQIGQAIDRRVIPDSPVKAPPTDVPGLGKGSVATTPVNDYKPVGPGSTGRSVPPMRPEDIAHAMGEEAPEEFAQSKTNPALKLLKDILADDTGSYRPRYDSGGPKGPDEPGNFEGLTPEEKIMQAVKERRPLTAEQKALHSKERSKRFAVTHEIGKQGRGLSGYYAKLGALKGALPKKDFESIAQHFTQADKDYLMNKIDMSNSLLEGEKMNAQTAILKLLGDEGGKLPSPAELKHLEDVFGEDFIKALLDARPFNKRLWSTVKSGLNVPRALMSSIDLSAPFRQGINFVGKKEFWKAIIPMVKVAFSEDASKALQAEIQARPTWEKMKRAKLAIVDPHSHFLADREEAFMSDLAEDIPGIGRLVKGSNRAYSGFLNKLRADVFDDLLRKYEAAGLYADKKKLREIARFVNSATGRGDLGKKGNAAAPLLSAALFSPRLIAGRAYMMSPHIYLKRDPILRKEAWKAGLAYGGYVLSLLGLATYAGLDVEQDPRSPDFAKIKKGNTRYDVTGGYQSYARLMAQIYTHSKISGSGQERELGGGLNPPPEGPYDESLADVLGRFFRSKESPMASLGHDFLAGENVIGEPFSRTQRVGTEKYGVDVNKEVLERFTPMALSDIYDVYNDAGFMSAIGAAPLAVSGVGVQTYAPRLTKEQKKAKKEELGDADFDMADDFDINEWNF